MMWSGYVNWSVSNCVLGSWTAIRTSPVHRQHGIHLCKRSDLKRWTVRVIIHPSTAQIGPWPPVLRFLILLFRHTVGLLWTSDQPVAKASTYTETQSQTSIPRAGFEPTIAAAKITPQTTRSLGLTRVIIAKTVITNLQEEKLHQTALTCRSVEAFQMSHTYGLSFVRQTSDVHEHCQQGLMVPARRMRVEKQWTLPITQLHNCEHYSVYTITQFAMLHDQLVDSFPPEGGVGLVPKRGCLLTLAYYAFPRWYEFEERRWNDIDRGKQKNSEKNLSQCHFVHNISHMDWPGREPGPPRWEAGD
jgi:hypothetical protein